MAWTTESRDKAAVTRQQNKEAREKISAQGVGESRTFAAPEGTFEESPILNMHVGGVLVRDMPISAQGRILHQQTDEGIAAANEGKSDIRVSVGDPLKKQLARKKDEVLNVGMETWEASDPMKEVIAQHGRPGFRNRFLSDATVKNKGLRGWQPVIVDGEPVKLGGMTLGEMPEGKARARNAHYSELGNQRLKQVTEKYMETGRGTALSEQ